MASTSNPTRRHRSVAAPLPSPIPTARGSRSAADEIFSRYLEASLRVPELAMPRPQHPPRRAPEVIDLESLVLRDGASVHRLMRSAREFGAFRIRGHGVSDEASRLLVREAERVSEVLEKKKGIDLREGGDFAGEGRGRDKEEVMIICFKGRIRWGQHYVEAETYRNLRRATGEVTSKLDVVAQEVSQVLSENLRAKPDERFEMVEPTLCVYGHVHDRHIIVPSPDAQQSHKVDEPFNYAFSMYLPVGKHSGFYLRTSRSPPYAFPASPSTVLVALGEPVEEWSDGELRSASWEPMFGHSHGTDHDDHIQNDGAETFFSLEYKCSPPWLNPSRDTTQMVVSICDQILIALFLACLIYSLAFLFSSGAAR
ncbi:uncharacterized protein LOC115685752 [Syzygium oleosum]|uniref:uncharacterized protein LOC115685752 n=1 Tax=Syzygium oleosum TaxID=219896 RepID=UPI0024BB580A|nr:uncharacterized protein LOC115685752 [Syzygium oleosum]